MVVNDCIAHELSYTNQQYAPGLYHWHAGALTTQDKPMNSLKIQRADGSSRTIGGISDCTHKYNSDSTATITVLVEVQDYQDEREVTLRTGDVAYLMSDTGNTLTPYYPAPKRGGV